MKQIPAHIITGFLGSGKTTFIRKLLKDKPQKERWAIVINEFSTVAIDSETIREEDKQAGNIYEIPGGCICCTASDMLRQNLRDIAFSNNYDRILIEPSGLGGIEHVEETVNSTNNLKQTPSICMVDLTAIDNPRLKINFLYQSQINHAAFIYFTKTDLLAPEQLSCNKNEFRKRFGRKKELNWNEVGDIIQSKQVGTTSIVTQKDKSPGFLAIDSKHQEYSSTILKIDKNDLVNTEKLFQLLSEIETIIRAKGHINTKDGWKLFNYSLSGFSIEKCSSQKRSELVILLEKENATSSKKIQEISKQIISNKYRH